MWPIFLFTPFCVERSVRFAAKSFNEAYAGWSKKSLEFVLACNWFLIVSTENWLLIFYVFWDEKTKTNNFSGFWFQMIPNDLFYGKLYAQFDWSLRADCHFCWIANSHWHFVFFCQCLVCQISCLMLCCCFSKLVKIEVMQHFDAHLVPESWCYNVSASAK